MQFHLENKSLSIDSSWVDCQQNLKSLSREMPFRADTHKHKRTHHIDLHLYTNIQSTMCTRAVFKIYISQTFDAQRKI